MDSSLFVRAALVQGFLVGALFAVLVALPLGDDFFEDYGWITGPLAWLGCAAVAGRILSLPAALAVLAALAGGVAGAIVGVAFDHTAGLVLAIAVFAASCAGYETADTATQ